MASNERIYLSLADFAEDTAEEFGILYSRRPAAGVFFCRGTSVEAEFRKPTTPEQNPLITVVFTHEILQAESVLGEEDLDSFMGKSIVERYTLWPSNFGELIALLGGRYKKLGLPVTGKNGGTADTKGWLDSIQGWPYKVRVYHYTAKNGDERAGFEWMKITDESVFEALGLNPVFEENEHLVNLADEADEADFA